MPTPADADPYVRAFEQDPDLAHDIGFDAPSLRTMRRTFRRERRDRAAGEAARFAVDVERRFAGLVLLHSFAWTHRRADCGVMLIPTARGRGTATEALRLLVAWAFGTLGLQRVGLHTLPENDAMQRLAERGGFAREGVLHAFTREWGRPVDNVVYGAWA